ncbi:MAG: hypothetical protein AB7G28_05970 [Pirellulales bacterium]
MVARILLISVVWATVGGVAVGQQYVTKQEFDDSIQKLSDQIAALAGVSSPGASLEERVAALEQNQKDLNVVQRDHGVVLGQIATRGDNGDYHWRFDTNSQSARNELRQAIKSAVPSQGLFVIHNRSSNHKDIVVNGIQHRIFAGATLELPVPAKVVKTWLPGEGTKYWRLDFANNFEQRIDLNDRYVPEVIRTLEQVAVY